MRDEPADISCSDIAGFLNDYWGFHPAEVTYAAVGGGCHHWIAADGGVPRWFVTANHLDPHGSWIGPTAEGTRIAEAAAMRAAKDLADGGYEFVVAPLPDRSGALTRHILPSWTLLVLPYLDGWSTQSGAWTDAAERMKIAGILGRLHTAVPPEALQRWDFAIPGRDALLTALGELGRPWTWGPYSEPTRRAACRSARSRPRPARTLRRTGSPGRGVRRPVGRDTRRAPQRQRCPHDGRPDVPYRLGHRTACPP